MLLELLGKVERIDRCQFDGLRVGCLSLLLVSQLDAQLFDVIGYLCLVLQRVINEEIVTDGIDIVDVCPDSVFIVSRFKTSLLRRDLFSIKRVLMFVFAPAPQAVVPVSGEKNVFFPVNRVYCVGRNYAGS